MMSLDLHRLLVQEAKEKILDFIDKAVANGEAVVRLIHGFNHGLKIKNMILRLSSKDHPAIQTIQPELGNSGSTLIYLKYFD
ncbi:Smr/MutS family protein [bacterium]|jgi:DNA-nicking Smr family endonuclease|nr:Smr/MutS family protein [bacterium]